MRPNGSSTIPALFCKIICIEKQERKTERERKGVGDRHCKQKIISTMDPVASHWFFSVLGFLLVESYPVDSLSFFIQSLISMRGENVCVLPLYLLGTQFGVCGESTLGVAMEGCDVKYQFWSCLGKARFETLFHMQLVYRHP